ncbi:MAG TPA: hypothetical protein VMU95_05770 [Trebonia sp.]|nr:hypothetical protein [Trebonia sp.]
MRPRSLARFLAVPVAAVGIAAGAAIAAPVANAQTTATNFDTGGTVSLTVPLSYIGQLAAAGIVEFPAKKSDLSISSADETATLTFTVTGGDADASVFRGSLDLSGSIVVVNVRHHHRHVRRFQVKLHDLQFDVSQGEIDGTPAHSSSPVVLLDLGSDSFTFSPVAGDPNGFNDTFDSAAVTVDPAGASYLDGALHTKAFQAGQAVGTAAASWSIEYPND